MVNIATYNVHGIGAAAKRRKIFSFLRKSVHDIICIQESHSAKSVERFWKSQWSGQIFYAHGDTNSRGCLILIRKKLKTTVHRILSDPNGRYLMIDLEVDCYRFLLCNLYAPNSDDVDFFQTVLNKAKEICPESLILAGDFNTAIFPGDKVAVSGNNSPGHPKCAKYLQNMLRNINMQDAQKLKNPTSTRYTWIKTKPSLLMERLDYIFVSNNLTGATLDADIDPAFASDHAIPHITLKDGVLGDKGPGYWKLNTRHLYDTEFCEKIRETIEDCNKIIDMKIRWELIKMKSRGEAIKFGARKKKAKQNCLEALKLKLYQNVVARDQTIAGSKDYTMFQDYDDHIVRLTKDISDLEEIVALRASKHNQSNWLAYGGKVSKYFFSLENKFPKKTHWPYLHW